MTRTFENFPALTSGLAFELIERLSVLPGLSAKFGFSNQSCSAYVNIEAVDEDGEAIDDGEFKVRFSDHADRYGSDITIRIDHLVEVIEDEYGEYVETRIEDWRYADALDQAEAAIRTFATSVEA